MGQPAKIRCLCAADAASLARLHAQGFERGWPESDMTEHISRDICLGIGSPLKGFIIIRRADDQAEILTITVDPSNRKTGLGVQLLSEGQRYAANAGITVLFLEAAEDNMAAIALYRRAGFAPIGRRPTYYKRAGGRVAALTFRKSLDGFRSKV